MFFFSMRYFVFMKLFSPLLWHGILMVLDSSCLQAASISMLRLETVANVNKCRLGNGTAETSPGLPWNWQSVT
jgi:hypothetical protein